MGLEEHLSEQVGAAGFPLQHAQSLRWSSTPQGLVSEPEMCTNIHPHTTINTKTQSGKWFQKKNKKRSELKERSRNSSNLQEI